MGDPITMAMIGAGVGAATNSDDPLKGALLGGVGGGMGGAFLGGGGGLGGSAGSAGTAGSAAGSAGAGAANLAPTAGGLGGAGINPATFTNAINPGAATATGSSVLPSTATNQFATHQAMSGMLPSTTANQAATAAVNPMMAGVNRGLYDLTGKTGTQMMNNAKGYFGNPDNKGMMGKMAMMAKPQQPQNRSVPGRPRGGQMRPFADMAPRSLMGANRMPPSQFMRRK